MVTLANGGAWLVNGAEIIADGPKAQAELAAKTGRTVSKEEAKKQTIAYGILENHNTSGSMEKLKIKFDKLTSHDITFEGIIQKARASGLEKFPVPYVLTNCHNSLCNNSTGSFWHVYLLLVTNSQKKNCKNARQFLNILLFYRENQKYFSVLARF